jgi:AraC family transcriptional regulator
VIGFVNKQKLPKGSEPLFLTDFYLAADRIKMQSKIVTLQEKKLVGKRKQMSFSDNKTRELWQSFMPKRNEIKNRAGTELYSVEVYNSPSFFQRFNPTAVFEKWAAVEVTDFTDIPADMETLLLPAGLYAVFIHYGPASEGPKTYEYIFNVWLPNAAYILDDRPHFALMGDKYKNDDPASEEEIWIPVKPK